MSQTNKFPFMRAKLKVVRVENHDGPHKEGEKPEKIGETISFAAVCPSGFDAEGKPVDDSNDFARWTPSADLRMYVTNPALFGQCLPDDEVYLDFSRAKADLELEEPKEE